MLKQRKIKGRIENTTQRQIREWIKENSKGDAKGRRIKEVKQNKKEIRDKEKAPLEKKNKRKRTDTNRGERERNIGRGKEGDEKENSRRKITGNGRRGDGD